jgi:hypothetical protein
LKAIVAGIEAVEVIPGRSEVVDEGQEFSVIIDAADTPKVRTTQHGKDISKQVADATKTHT